MTPDLEKLRRFALGTALILIAFAAAGVELVQGAQISVFGVPFTIHRPSLLPLAFVLASAYGMARFYYYGMMLKHSPQRVRKDLLHELHPVDGRGTYSGSVFFGPSTYEVTPWHYDRAVVERQVREIKEAFPKVWRRRVTAKFQSMPATSSSGEEFTSFSAEVYVPVECRLAALLQDLDYTAPVWLNICALTVSVPSLVP